MAAKPIILPEPFDGTGNWDEWMFHFENVADINEWDDDQKLKFIRVRMTGRAMKTLHLLPEASRETYAATKAALKARFDPDSRHTRYEAELQSRRKKASEGWADFAEDLKFLADKAYPTLQQEARERLAINAYLQQLTQPQLAFSVRQKRPDTIDDAVAATLEIESYMPVLTTRAGVNALQSSEEPATVAAVDQTAKLTTIVERLAEQVEALQRETKASNRRDRRPRREERQEPSRGPRQQRTTQQRLFDGECWRCHQHGHISRNCTQPLPARPQGN